jgi:hypothetical protein
MDLKSYPTVAAFMDQGYPTFQELMEELVADLLAIHKDWSKKDALNYLMNRTSRYTPEWQWLELELLNTK